GNIRMFNLLDDCMSDLCRFTGRGKRTHKLLFCQFFKSRCVSYQHRTAKGNRFQKRYWMRLILAQESNNGGLPKDPGHQLTILCWESTNLYGVLHANFLR